MSQLVADIAFSCRKACADMLISRSPAVQELEELGSCPIARSHATKHAAGCRLRTDLLNPSHDHAEMTGFHNHRNTLWIQDNLNCQCHLFRQTFLDLQAPCKHFRNSCQLGKTQDPPVGYITNMHLLE